MMISTFLVSTYRIQYIKIRYSYSYIAYSVFSATYYVNKIKHLFFFLMIKTKKFIHNIQKSF